MAGAVKKGRIIKKRQRSAAEQDPRLFDCNPQPSWVYEEKTLRFLAVNQAAVEFFGYPANELVDAAVADLAVPEQKADFRKAMTETGEELDPVRPWRLRKKSGITIEVELSSRSVVFHGTRAFLVACRDITEQKRTETQMIAFSEMGRRLSAARTRKDAAQIVMATAETLFRWDACVFDLRSETGGNLVSILCLDTIDGSKRDVTGQCLDCPPGTHAAEALEHGARLILRQEVEKVPPDTRPFGDKTRPSASLMFAPVRKEHEAIGVISIQSYRSFAYNESDLRSFQALADHCAVALERIGAEEEVQRLNTELQRKVNEVMRLNVELERRVERRTAQLEAINKELEAFCYSVSHDLRAPLRSIRGFSEVLLEKHASKLDPRGREFLSRACDSSQQMDRLIENLLKLSRVGRAELQQQTVNLSALAQAVAEELRQAEPQRRVRFMLPQGLAARGDSRLLRIVLDNLLRNAWKFTSHRPDAVIEIGFDPAQAAFFVKDNGAGFDMAYASKLFGVFQRLHSASEFPGTGVGLATVQRIINRHGGKVWAQAAVDQGATFYFTLPHEESP